MMRDRDVAYVPTMSGLVHIPYQYRASGRQDMYDLIMARFIDPLRDSVRMAAKMGIRIGTGSDTAGDLVEELELIHESTDFTAMQCIHAATREAAKIAGVDESSGTLTAGRQADILAVEGDPLQRISDLRRPRWVMRAGELHDGAPLPLGVRMSTIDEERELSLGYPPTNRRAAARARVGTQVPIRRIDEDGWVGDWRGDAGTG